MKVSKVLRDRMHAEGFLTVPEVAEKVGQSEGTVRTWLDDDRVESMTVGGARFVRLSSVATMLGKDVSRILGLEAK